jgi:hypothetical protein
MEDEVMPPTHLARSFATLTLLALTLPANAQAPAGAGKASPLDTPLRLIAEARESYRNVRDYTCLFVKRERMHGKLEAENLINMQVRAQPFSVAMHWMRPLEMSRQEVCYVEGRNNGMMRVHSPGLLGVVGFMSIDPKDSRALEHSRHPIFDIGIGNLIERFGSRWEEERRLNKTEVRIAEFEYDKRRCLRVETTHPDNNRNQFLFYRSSVYFDRETHLPIRVENYDFPRRGEDPKGVLAESYSYASLRLNAGVNEAAFNR